MLHDLDNGRRMNDHEVDVVPGRSRADVATRLFAEKNVKVLTINIDDNPNGWDAHYLQQLSVNHIPYMIMVDPEGKVTARDIRSWELYKLRSKK